MARLRFTDGLRALAAGLVLIVFCAGAHAEDAAGCKALAWPLDQERAAFASDKLESVGSGAARGPWKEQTLALKLAPQESVTFAAPTGGKRKPKGKVFGGTLSFDAPAQAERYYVTLSSEGWIDVVQNGAGHQVGRAHERQGLPGPAQERALSRGSVPRRAAVEWNPAGYDQDRHPAGAISASGNAVGPSSRRAQSSGMNR